MKVTVIEAHNFLSHELTRVEFNGDRLSTFAGANGAGKSALLETLLYTLYDAARGRTDDLVRLGSSEMSATVVFEFGGNEYRVTRGRSTRAGGKSFLDFHVRDVNGEAWMPLTKDSIRETQAAIAELLRLDADTFATAAFLRQGEADRFISATAGDRKKILATVLGLDRYERAEARARELARDVDAKAAAARDQVERLTEQLADRQTHADAVDHYRGQLADLAEAREEHTNELARFREERTALAVKESEIAAARAEVTRLEGELVAHTDAWKAARQRGSVADQQRARARATLAQADRIHEAEERIPRLEERLSQARADAAEFQAAVDARMVLVLAHRDAQRDLEAAERQLQAFEAQRADKTICPECGAEIPAGGKALEERIEAASVVQSDAATFVRGLAPVPDDPVKPALDPWAISEQLTEAKGIAAGAAALEEAQRIVDETTAAIEAATAEMNTAEAAGKTTRTALDAATAKVAESDPTAAIADVELRIRTHTAALETIAGQERDATAAMARAQAALDGLAAVEKERDALAVGVEASVAEGALLRRLVTAFGANGIPARIIEGTAPELTRYTNELLAQLRPDMSLEIRTQRAKRSGDGVIESLDLIVRDSAGERPLSLFSGGERMSCSLALAVGLSRLVARRAGMAIRTLVIDEPDGLDSGARRAFGQALRLLAHHGELDRVLLISHHEDLAEVGDAVYRVSKDAAGSHVEQVA